MKKISHREVDIMDNQEKKQANTSKPRKNKAPQREKPTGSDANAPPKRTERNVPKRQSIIERTVKYMKSLGTYKVEYKQIIEIYADMLYQYNILSREFEQSKFQTTIQTERSGGKKDPKLATMENLRKDIGVYSDRLMLNAKTYNAEIEKPKEEQSALAAFMESHKTR